MAVVTLTIRENVTALGISFPKVTTVDADGAVVKAISVPAAKTGQLTTRTDNNTGTLTMSGGHGITNGARLDLYWDGGSRRGMVVGSVATNSVPIDLGSGDNLPTNLTEITAMVPLEESFAVTGDDAVFLSVYSDKAGQIVFAESDDGEAKAYSVGGAAGGDQSVTWTLERDSDNPLATFDVAKVFFSHGNSDAAASMKAVVGFN